jgi:hypothetical protein
MWQLAELEESHIQEYETRAPVGYNLARGGAGTRVSNSTFNFLGNRWISVTDLALHYNVAPATIYYRMNAGWTDKQIVGIDSRPPHPNANPIEVKGRAFDSQGAASEYFEQSIDVTNARLREGWSVDQAFRLTAPPRGITRKQPVAFDGTVYKNATEACLTKGFKPRTISHYAWRRGLSFLETLKQFIAKQRQSPERTAIGCETLIDTPDGRRLNVTEAAIAFHLKPGTLRSRLSRGWTIRQALGLDPRSHSAVHARGSEYPSIAAAARKLGLSLPAIYQRIHKGEAPESALSRDVRPSRRRRKAP